MAAETTGGGYQNMRKYEMVVILDPSVDERTVTGTFEKLVQVVPTEGGTIDNVDVWGKRKFAYEIDKKSEGIYIVLQFTAKSSTAQELDRQLGLNESVMRTKLMRLDAE
ncbi:small subunit ribosomal protein S6 [Brachybacterium sp. AG952]|nr:small subunit ribosomal protein S6 [Brachybacterium sp. AG952]GAP78727.1 SSU ribosomal protein S6p [Brachybacterium sp. SW0106-09]